jgi:hypothetical protein
MTVAQQLTKAVQTAQDNKLTKPHVSVRCPDDIPDEFAVKALPVNDTVALRSLEVWITTTMAISMESSEITKTVARMSFLRCERRLPLGHQAQHNRQRHC